MLGLKLRRAEIRLQRTRAQGKTLTLTVGDRDRGFAAECCDLTLKITDAGLARVIAYYFAYSIVADFELSSLQAVLFALLRQQMLLCYAELFLIGIA